MKRAEPFFMCNQTRKKSVIYRYNFAELEQAGINGVHAGCRNNPCPPKKALPVMNVFDKLTRK